MDETIGMEVDQVQADVDLNVVGQWFWGSVQECSETFITKFHEENRQLGVRVIVGTRYWTTLGCLAKLSR